jgi:uncharacterized coiled-coil protein SlyX
MNSSLEDQIQSLNFKVDQLHRIVLQLSQQIRTLTDRQISRCGNESRPYATINSYHSSLESSSEPVDQVASRILHKDILIDEDDNLSFWGLQNEQPLTAEIQIHRLTAQITAAYHRIAALEEQLMAQRAKL